MGYGINPPFNGVDPFTGKVYVAGQNVPIRHPQSPSTVSASTGQRRPPVAPVAEPPAPYRGSTAPNMTADRAERYVQNLAQQSDAALAGMVPTAGYSLEDILKMLGLGAKNGGGGSRRRGGSGNGMGNMKWPDVQKALQGASTNIAGAYSTAGDQLSKLINEYAAADAARRQSQAQTLQAFGAPQSAADVGGMSAMDVLTALRGQTAAQGAMQQADIEQQLAAYKALLGGK